MMTTDPIPDLSSEEIDMLYKFCVDEVSYVIYDPRVQEVARAGKTYRLFFPPAGSARVECSDWGISLMECQGSSAISIYSFDGDPVVLYSDLITWKFTPDVD